VRRPHVPKTVVHLGKAKDMGGDAMADATTFATYGAYVRGEARREALAVPESTYWPAAPFMVSLEEIRLLLEALSEEQTPERLRPLRAEFAEAYTLGSVGAGPEART
jgi:hypothetical protein